MFELTEFEIERKSEKNLEAGAYVTFEGIVRNHNAGMEVESLEYEVYPAMALKEGEKIIQEVVEKYQLLDAYCTHRYGHLFPGDIAVIVGTLTPHREEAFAACKEIIDRVKSTVPIWKKEYYKDRAPVWVACHRCQETAHAES